MSHRHIFFAGGGTGGHIYPALAVAHRLVELQPDVTIQFFCSTRPIDSAILSKTQFHYTPLPAKGLYSRPDLLARFCWTFAQAYRRARAVIQSADNPVVVGVGGFVAAPVCFAGHRLTVPVKLISTDAVPGKANRLIARWADEIFVQFPISAEHFARASAKIHVVGCPIRAGFRQGDRDVALRTLNLDPDKHTLLITGASSGAANINQAVRLLLDKISAFADSWQIVHLTGSADHQRVIADYADTPIAHAVLEYSDDMPALLSAADLVIGRSGAISVAEYAAARVPSVCLPYPHHKDKHQYVNAQQLAQAGAAVIVHDVPDPHARADNLWNALQPLMTDDQQRARMSQACSGISPPDADLKIAHAILNYPAPSHVPSLSS